MNDFASWAIRWAVRIVLLVAGAVFFLSLLAVACVLAAVWGVRALWAKLTGQPVTAWSLPLRGAASWSSMYQRAGGFGARPAQTEAEAPATSPFGGPAAGSKRSGVLSAVAGDITDVQPRELREG